MHQMVKLPIPLARCALVVQLWHFWGNGLDHRAFIFLPNFTNSYLYAKLYIQVLTS